MTPGRDKATGESRRGPGSSGSRFGYTPLSLAAVRDHSKVMGALIEAGANVNGRALTGATPLFVAAQAGQPQAVKVLLRAKSRPAVRKPTWRVSGTRRWYRS